MRVKYIILIVAVVAVCCAMAETAKQLGKRPGNMVPVQGAPEFATDAAAPPPEPQPRPEADKGPVELQVQDAAPVEASAVPAPAETPAPAPEPPAPQMSTPPSDAPVPAPEAAAPAEQAEDAEPDLAQVVDELRQLREDMLKLQQTVDALSNNVLEENRQLREQLRQAYQGGAMAVPSVPTPEKALIEKALQSKAPAEGDEPGAAPAEADAGANAANAAKSGDGFTVVAEWGRTPEAAKALQPPKSSLKGMIAFVNPGTNDEQLAELGRKLHKDFDSYDNINLEVFDTEKAAYEFKRGRSADDHRVMSISRHRESGRDLILIIRGEIVKEVPFDAPAKQTEN
jgi:hypothetical protein